MQTNGGQQVATGVGENDVTCILCGTDSERRLNCLELDSLACDKASSTKLAAEIERAALVLCESTYAARGGPFSFLNASVTYL